MQTKYYSIIAIIIAALLLSSCATTRLDNPETCDKELVKALSKPTDAEKVSELKKRVQRCPRHVPTLLETARLYTKLGKEADENWLELSLRYYRVAVDSQSNNLDAHWGLASVLEYVGEYERASKEYQWVIENATDLSRKADARVHKITCDFLQKHSKQKQAGATGKTDSIDISSERIKERSGWDYLKELVASVAVAGGITALKGDGVHLQFALGLLYDWIDSPKGKEVEARTRFLAGMVSTIASIIAENKLETKLGVLYDPSKNGMPDAGYAGEIEKGFKDGKPDEGRTFEISNDLTITEKWDVPNIDGEWAGSCIRYCPPCSPGYQRTTANSTTTIKQSGRNIIVVVDRSEIPGDVLGKIILRGKVEQSTFSLEGSKSVPYLDGTVYEIITADGSMTSPNRIILNWKSTSGSTGRTTLRFTTEARCELYRR